MSSVHRSHPSSWVTFGVPDPLTHRLVCAPYAGGGASTYRSWPEYAAPGVGVVALRPPGRETRLDEPPVCSVAQMVQDLVRDLEQIAHDEVPYSLFGHSLGAIVAFELAHEILDRGWPPPQRLIVSGRCAPHVRHGIPGISHLSDDAFLTRLHELGGLSEEILQAEELVALLLPSLRADFVAAESYTWTGRPSLPIPISAFGGDHDDSVSAAQIEAWGDLTHAGFRHMLLDGDHFFLRPRAAELVEMVCRHLGQPPSPEVQTS